MNNTLNKLMNKFIIKTHHFIVFEDDVLKTIEVINKNRNCIKTLLYGRIRIWSDGRIWHIVFKASNTEWCSLINELKVIRVWDISCIPKTMNGSIYSTD